MVMAWMRHDQILYDCATKSHPLRLLGIPGYPSVRPVWHVDSEHTKSGLRTLMVHSCHSLPLLRYEGSESLAWAWAVAMDSRDDM